MEHYMSLAEAYESGLRTVLAGERIESVLDPLSKASNFGSGDRPSREVLCHQFAIDRPSNCLVSGPVVRLHLPYCFGLLAFTLSGSNELRPLRNFAQGAAEYPDDGWQLRAAFAYRRR